MTANSAAVWVTVCGWFWIIHNLFLLAIVLRFKEYFDVLNAKDPRMPGGNNLFFFFGIALVIMFSSVSIGMLSKSPTSLRWAYVLSCFGSFFWTLEALAKVSVVMVAASPQTFTSALVVCVGATMTYVTRWAVKRV